MPTDDPRFTNEIVPAGQTSILVEFPQPIADVSWEQVIVCDEEDDIDVTISDLTETGFQINCDPAPSQDLEVYWLARTSPFNR